MKKIISGILALALVFGTGAALPEGAVSLGSDIVASAETYGDYEYTVLDDGTVEITKYSGSDTKVSIPAAIVGKKVTSIGERAFYWCSKLESITIPNGVISIKDRAFMDCENVKSVTIPNSVTSIGTAAFEGCTSLKSITIPKRVTDIGILALGYYWNESTLPVNGFTIYGYAGTAAETYANDKGFTFIPLEDKRTPGDANDDGEVSVADVLLIQQKLAKWNVAINESNADVTGDGEVSVADVLLIQQKLAKWNVTLK